MLNQANDYHGLEAPVSFSRRKRLIPILAVLMMTFFVSCSLMFYACRKSNPVAPSVAPVHTQQDTTSHDVTWTVHVFGDPDGGSSYFKDVFAISDTDVWAVGVINVKDDQGNWGNPCNAAHWDGKEWKLMSFKLASAYPQDSGYQDLKAVFAFSHNDVWFFSNMSYLHWDGKKFTSKYVWYFYGAIERVWGLSSKLMYIVGSDGAITITNGDIFQSVNSGTSCDLLDVRGDAHGTVWVGGYQNSPLIDLAFLRITDIYHVTAIRTSRWPLDLAGVNDIWISRDTLYAVCGSGIFIQSTNDSTHWRFLAWSTIALPVGYIRGMRGTADNNIFLAGDFGTIIHYNGKSWYMYPFFSLSRYLGFYSVAVCNKKVYAVGWDDNDQAVIYEGTQH